MSAVRGQRPLRAGDVAGLRRELAHLRKHVVRLARALHTHTRTDLAPDTALPLMRKIVDDLEAGK